ncbi:hypothetical protein OfM1_05270 [Lactovum odontotermitis]
MKKLKRALFTIVLLVIGMTLLACNRSTKVNSPSDSMSSSKMNSDLNLPPFPSTELEILQEVSNLAKEKDGMLEQSLDNNFDTWSLAQNSVSSYEFSLWVYKMEPQTQAGFDGVKDKTLPFLDLLLKKLKDLKVTNPRIYLIINVPGLNAYKSGINDKYLIK